MQGNAARFIEGCFSSGSGFAIGLSVAAMVGIPERIVILSAVVWLGIGVFAGILVCQCIATQDGDREVQHPVENDFHITLRKEDLN
jgi:hypothetical protein